MNLFDILFVVIVLAFTLLSFLRGAVKELFSLLGLVGGFVAATWYDTPLAAKLAPLLPDANAAELLAFVLVMMVGYFVGVFLGGFSDMFGRAPTSDLSRLVGAAIGLAKGATISLALFWVIETHIPAFHDEMRQSGIGVWLAALLDYLRTSGVV